MRRFASAFLAVMLVSFLMLTMPLVASAEPIEITIFHTNDVHGRVLHDAGMGYAMAAGYVDAARSAGKNVLLLDAGDTLHGLNIATASKGLSIVRIMNAMGYDAMAPGNHDFNYGLDRLRELEQEAEFPMLSCNIYQQDGTLAFTPYKIEEIAGKRIGIIGVQTPDLVSSIHPSYIQGLTFQDGVKCVSRVVAEIGDQTDAIIVLAHWGQTEVGVSSDVLAQIEGVNLVIDGHSHTVMEGGKAVGDALKEPSLADPVPPAAPAQGGAQAEAGPSPNGTQGKTAAEETLEAYLKLWQSGNDWNDMVQYTAPEWRERTPSPMQQLFWIHKPRELLGWTLKPPVIADGDTAVNIEVIADLRLSTGMQPKLRYSALMLLVDGAWFVDPSSLVSGEAITESTPDPDAVPIPAVNTSMKPYIVSAGEYLKYLGKVTMVIDDQAVTLRAELIPTPEVYPSESIEQAIGEVQAMQKTLFEEKVGLTKVELNGERAAVRTKETNLGNLITDAIRSVTGTDVAMVNGGSIRATIEAGVVTRGDVVNVLPFGNYVITKRVKGADLRAALEHSLSAYPEQAGGFLQVSGIALRFDPAMEAGHRIVELLIGGKQLEDEKEYAVALNDFLASGGDGYAMFANQPIAYEFGGLDELLIQYLQEQGEVSAQVEGRILAVQ